MQGLFLPFLYSERDILRCSGHLSMSHWYKLGGGVIYHFGGGGGEERSTGHLIGYCVYWKVNKFIVDYELLVLKWVIIIKRCNNTCLKIEYNFCRVGLFSGSFRKNFHAWRFKSILHLINLSDIKKTFFQDIHPSRNSMITVHFNVSLLNFCISLKL